MNIAYGCLSYDNTGDGFSRCEPSLNTIINCVFDSNGAYGIRGVAGTTTYAALLIGNRITNHNGASQIGLFGDDESFILGYNYFEDNYGNNVQNTLQWNIPLSDGTTSNVEDQANTNEGYVGSGDYNLASGASLFSQAITIPET